MKMSALSFDNSIKRPLDGISTWLRERTQKSSIEAWKLVQSVLKIECFDMENW